MATPEEIEAAEMACGMYDRPVRPSTFIDMGVWLHREARGSLPAAREMAVVRDVLYTAFVDDGGCVNERIKVIVEIMNGPRGGKFVSTELNKLERRY